MSGPLPADTQEIKVQVLDVSGRSVFAGSAIGSQLTWNVEGIAGGSSPAATSSPEEQPRREDRGRCRGLAAPSTAEQNKMTACGSTRRAGDRGLSRSVPHRTWRASGMSLQAHLRPGRSLSEDASTMLHRRMIRLVMGHQGGPKWTGKLPDMIEQRLVPTLSNSGGRGGILAFHHAAAAMMVSLIS